MAVGKRIREIRKKLNLTQGDFAKKINVSSQVISNWEREYTKPNSEDIERIATILEINTNYLYGLTNDPAINESQKELDDEYRIIERFARKVSSKDREKALNILKLAFEDAFNEDEDDEDEDL